MTTSVNTRTRRSPTPKAALKLPHEQDESVGMTGAIPSQPVQQAHQDLTRGLVDTDRGAEADRTYRKLKGTAK